MGVRLCFTSSPEAGVENRPGPAPGCAQRGPVHGVTDTDSSGRWRAAQEEKNLQGGLCLVILGGRRGAACWSLF